MAMALKRDVQKAQADGGQARPVDLVHLCSQTAGDDALRAEIISMFINQAHTYLDGIASKDGETAFRAAHSLKGAARAIGAFDLAALAEAAEQVSTRDIEAVGAETRRVCTYLSSITRS